MDKFQNKYRIPSARFQKWDYGWNGAYFLTICTKNRECFFGEIVQGEMKLSEIGQLAEKFLLEIPERYPYAILDEFKVMPNHIHAIVIMDKTDDGRNIDDVCRDAIYRVSMNPPNGPAMNTDAIYRVSMDSNNNPVSVTETDAINRVSTDSPDNSVTETDAINRVSTDTPNDPVTGGGVTGNKNPMLHDNIFRIMNWYTGRVTFESRKINSNYGWQARFHDHIIRNDAEFQMVRAYIHNNPQNWENDTLKNRE